MDIGQSLTEALSSLTTNKLRSGLTILGIVIGVAAVIAMLSIGTGAQSSITSSINGIGTNMLYITPGSQSQDVRNPKPLMMADAQAMQDQFAAPAVAAVAPVVQGRFTITFEGKDTSTSVSGVTPEYAGVSNEQMDQGQFISEDNLLSRSAVAVIGPTTAQNLFGTTDGVIDQTIRIDKQPFRVIGVLKAKGGSGFGNQDDRILVPITTAQSRLLTAGASNNVSQILVQAVSADSVTAAQEQVSEILRLRHRTNFGLDDFSILSQAQVLSVANTITGIFTIFLGGIGGISLLVGGIGIMNIMLVSVTERTREIGLRKALGARKRDILVQFLTESVLLCLIGGIIGVGLAWVITTIVGVIASRSGTPFSPSIGLSSILLATIFSSAVGLLFGLYPSSRAASLQPVEALRYE
jgi:putative ABC transport system permease protein